MIQKTLLMVAMLFGLTSCAILYHDPVQQGNIITAKEIHSVYRGMSETALVSRLGSPILRNIFSNNEKLYVYYFSNTRSQVRSYWLKVYVRGGRVVGYQTTYQEPQQVRALKKTKAKNKK